MKQIKTSLAGKPAAMRPVLLGALACLLLALLFAGAVGAQTSTSYDLSWSTLNGSGGEVSGERFAMSGVAGETAVGAASSPSFGVGSGQPPLVPPAAIYRIYLPLVLQRAP